MGKITQEDMQKRDVFKEIVENSELPHVLKGPLGARVSPSETMHCAFKTAVLFL